MEGRIWTAPVSPPQTRALSWLLPNLKPQTNSVQSAKCQNQYLPVPCHSWSLEVSVCVCWKRMCCVYVYMIKCVGVFACVAKCNCPCQGFPAFLSSFCYKNYFIFHQINADLVSQETFLQKHCSIERVLLMEQDAGQLSYQQRAPLNKQNKTLYCSAVRYYLSVLLCVFQMAQNI